MIKSKLRSKILKLKINNINKNFKIYPNRFFSFIKKNKYNFKNLGGYYPTNFEIDDLDILKIFEKKNYNISLPKISKNNQMNFFKWSFKDPLSVNSYGIPEPVSSNIVYPDILLIPLVAFNKDLFRLGYGGGYYDRTFNYLKKNNYTFISIGYAFDGQKVSEVPKDEFDIKLDYVITDKQIYSFL